MMRATTTIAVTERVQPRDTAGGVGHDLDGLLGGGGVITNVAGHQHAVEACSHNKSDAVNSFLTLSLLSLVFVSAAGTKEKAKTRQLRVCVSRAQRVLRRAHTVNVHDGDGANEARGP